MPDFPPIRFDGTLRPSQAEAVAHARRELDRGGRRLHIVAPPGSGKTVLGLYLWAEYVQRPAVVLSPNSAIQAQWAARTDLFDVPDHARISTDPHAPGHLTSLTYQALTLPRRGDVDLDADAVERWIDHLVAIGHAEHDEEALAWIDDLRAHNPGYHDERLAVYRKKVRDERAIGGDAVATLHASARGLLGRLRAQDLGLIILDEAHHLLGHWGRVLADAETLFRDPIVIGLTATPPDVRGKRPEDVERYRRFFGPIDFEVPVPAVVKDGYLAPYQDLAYFVRPARLELAFVASADDTLHALVDELCAPAPETGGTPLTAWVTTTLAERRLPAGGVAADFARFDRRDPEFSQMARRFLRRRGVSLPPGVPPPAPAPPEADVPEMAELVPVLDRYVRHHLRRSPDPADHTRAERLTRRLRTLGVQITETGAQACASPVSRVLAYSRSKAAALVRILATEHAALGERLRAVVVTDYEKTSATTAEIAHLLDAEAGGAIAAFRAILADPGTDTLHPILVTGSSVLVDDDLAAAFDAAAATWLRAQAHDVTLRFGEEDGFHVVGGDGPDWCPRVYVALITELFQRGLTQCLVGTRGLLGEGWDASRANVLVDLTTVTTSMSVNQLRGRSIRLDRHDPEKVANNWDVVCIAPEFSRGLDDYQRFIAKHETLYGATEDGAIEKGVGHVHAAFTRMRPEGLEGSMAALNEDMLRRASERHLARERWRIGEPYHGASARVLETRGPASGGGFPPFRFRRDPWSDASLTQAIGDAVLGALREAKLLPRGRVVRVSERMGGYVRAFLERATEEESALFTDCLRTLLGPLEDARYVIPRIVVRRDETWLSRLLPDALGRYVRRRRRETVMLHAVPSPLARNKTLARIFQKHWNRHVSPGVALYAHRGPGRTELDAALQAGRVPRTLTHEKEVYF
ncbi:MAG: DEAD/DEAH box helicase family protein [Phycisphaerales bacterium]|nr:DEAD/DEAH box helicase family protein [Phycisphaerales bacterium]